MQQQLATLTETARRELVERKVTCPFLGPAVAANLLTVWNDAAKPLARVDDVVTLGNSGGGDLGEVLHVFAQGNHALMPGASGALDTHVPIGFFSLDLPGSQGSHPGHSGILQGDPAIRDSGRFSAQDFARLLSHADDGVLKRSEIGRFIAHNVHADGDASVFPAGRLLVDVIASAAEAPRSLLHWIADKLGREHEADEHRELLRRLTKAAGDSNLVGSCGEFGLLLAFLEHKPGAPKVGDEPAVSVADVTSMFEHKQFPAGWESWPKTSKGWVTNTLALLHAATSELLRQGRG